VHSGKVLSVSDQRKTSDDGQTSGSGTDAPDGIEDAELVGDKPAERREVPETDPTVETPAEPGADRPDEPSHETAPPEDMAQEAAPEIGPAEDGRIPEDARAEEPAGREEAPEPVAAPRQRGAGGYVVALVFGALLAAGAGIATARFVFPDGWPGQGDTAAEIAGLRAETEARGAEIAGLEATIQELSATVRALDDRIAALPDPDAATEGLRADLESRIAAAATAASDVSGRLDAVEQGLSGLDAQLSELAQRPVPEALDTASLDAELAEFREDLTAAVEEARAELLRAEEEAAAIAAAAEAEAAAREQAAAEEAEALRAEAEAAAATAAREAAISRIRAAIENGEPYAGDLAALGAEVPDALAGPAADGVPSLAALAEAFPPAARQALDASIRATMGEGALDRVTAFLRVQTGARSLEARPGDDPDAVLSRAEAALRAGALDAALSELAALPEAGQAAMAGWIDAARTRHEAAAAARALTPN
jgi:hypothetical protein